MEEHRKCPKCGMELRNNICPLCGYSEYDKKEFRFPEFISILKRPIFIVFLIWTIYILISSPSMLRQVGALKGFAIYVFGIVFFCGITYLITKKKFKNDNKNGVVQSTNEIITPTPQYNAVKESIPLFKTPNMSGHDFEYYCADLLKKNGFDDVIVTKGSGDHGIDILAEKDGISYAIQCKYYTGNVGNSAIQQALTGKAFYKKDIAVVLTNSNFTKQAKEEAEATGVKLWDCEKLESLAK